MTTPLTDNAEWETGLEKTMVVDAVFARNLEGVRNALLCSLSECVPKLAMHLRGELERARRAMAWAGGAVLVEPPPPKQKGDPPEIIAERIALKRRAQELHAETLEQARLAAAAKAARIEAERAASASFERKFLQTAKAYLGSDEYAFLVAEANKSLQSSAGE